MVPAKCNNFSENSLLFSEVVKIGFKIVEIDEFCIFALLGKKGKNR